VIPAEAFLVPVSFSCCPFPTVPVASTSSSRRPTIISIFPFDACRD
jgi:hypothetical protein